MDYKYIEQLLERYWECQTTLDEEAILRTFFRQEDVPASLLPYRQLFLEEDALASEHVGKEFQEKVLRLVGEESTLPFGEGMGAGYCKARRMTFMRRLRPFYRAACLGAILLTIGDAAQQSFTNEGDAAAALQVAEQTSADSLQDITIGLPEQQSAALATQPVDTLNTMTR